MGTVVMKFGGTSVGGPERIRSAARRVLRVKRAGNKVAVVVSAMGDSTDDLLALAGRVCEDPPKREVDQLLSTGEQVTISLMAMALHDLGAPAISFTAGQIGMVTDDAHTKARIKSIDVRRIREQLDAGRIVIVAGFQGVTREGAVTTLGRGGSNVTLVAVAAALKADVCENLTDVDGIYTADPRLVPSARKVARIGYDEMLELASLGANVLHNRAVEFAKKYRVRIHVRSSMNERKGTLITDDSECMEKVVVTGAALKEKLARVIVKGVPDQPGVAARVFHAIGEAHIVVDDIMQIIGEDGRAVIAFGLEQSDLREARRVISRLCRELGCEAAFAEDLAKVSVVGSGMRVHSGVAERMFEALAGAKINIENISTSEIKISCLIDRRLGKKALRVVHDAFRLGGGKKR